MAAVQTHHPGDHTDGEIEVAPREPLDNTQPFIQNPR